MIKVGGRERRAVGGTGDAEEGVGGCGVAGLGNG